MAISMRKMKDGFEKHQSNGAFWTPQTGDTLVYIHGQCRPNDKWEPTEGVNYVEISVHYGVGLKNAMVVSLDSSVNPIIEHPYVKAFLKKRKNKFKMPSSCPMAKALNDGTLSDAESDESRRLQRFVWGVTPMQYRPNKGSQWQKLPQQPSVMVIGKTVFDGIMELFIEAGDITDLDSAILVNIHREGKNKNDTRYKISADMKTVRKPIKIDGSLRKKIEAAMAEGGDCDLFKVVSNMIKSPDEIKVLLSNVKTDDSDDDEDEDGEDGEDDSDGDEYDSDGDDSDEDDSDEDDEDEDEEDHDEDDSDEEDEDEEDHDEDDSDEDDEDEDEDEDHDEDDSDEDEEDDEDEEEVKKQPKKTKALPEKKPAKFTKEKSKKAEEKSKSETDEDDGDIDLDELDEEIERISGKKSEKTKSASSPKKGTKKGKAK